MTVGAAATAGARAAPARAARARRAKAAQGEAEAAARAAWRSAGSEGESESELSSSSSGGGGGGSRPEVDEEDVQFEVPDLEQERAAAEVDAKRAYKGALRAARAAPVPAAPVVVAREKKRFRQALVVCDDEPQAFDLVSSAGQGRGIDVDDVLVIEGCTDDDDDAKFQRRIQREVLLHLQAQGDDVLGLDSPLSPTPSLPTPDVSPFYQQHNHHRHQHRRRRRHRPSRSQSRDEQVDADFRLASHDPERYLEDQLQDRQDFGKENHLAAETDELAFYDDDEAAEAVIEEEEEGDREDEGRRRPTPRARAHSSRSRTAKRRRTRGGFQVLQGPGDKDVKIIWDVMTMAELQTHASHIVSFFVPPVIYLPAMFLVRVFVLWPLFFAMRVAAFAHNVSTRVWPILVDLVKSSLFFPQRLAIRVLLYAQDFADGVLAYLHRTRCRIEDLAEALRDVGALVVARIKLMFTRKRQKRRRHNLQRALKRAIQRAWRSVRDGLDALGRLVYLVFLPARVAYHALSSFAWASSTTLGTLASIPVRVGVFVVNSPSIVGRSIKRFYGFVKANRRDVVDVLIALAFLVVLGMIITGVFVPLLRACFRASILFFQHLQYMLGRLRVPRLRIPRLNVAKLREVLPFRLPKLPVPDLGLLLGLRERTFWEKIAYIFSD